jgi:hypothetical protein
MKSIIQRKDLLKELNCEEMCVLEKKNDLGYLSDKVEEIKKYKNCLC